MGKYRRKHKENMEQIVGKSGKCKEKKENPL
jgi:hypothetical protein